MCKSIDFCKISTNFTDNLSSITGTITALSQFLSGSLLGKFGQSMKSVSHLIKEVPNFSAVTSEGIRSLAAAVEGLNYADQAMILAQNKVTKSTIALTLATNGAESADINATMATIGNVTAKEKLTEAELADILTLQYGNRERAVAVASQIAKTVADQNGTLAIENLTVAELKNIATTNGLTTAEAVGTAQMLGMKGATIGLSGAIGTLGATISSVLLALKTIAPELILISVAIAGVIAAWKYINKADEQRKKLGEESEQRKQKYQEEIETAKRMTTEYSNSAKSLESYTDKYIKLSKKVSLSSEDKQELIDVQQELIKTYGSEAEGIDLVNGKYEDNIKLLTQLTQKEKERARQNALAVYYDSKNQTFTRNENGGSKIVDEYQGVSKKDTDKVYRKIMSYAEALQLLEESTFGDGTYWGSKTFLSLNPNLSTDELIKALDTQIDAMDKYFDREEKATKTWQEQYAKLTALRSEAIEKQKEEIDILNKAATNIIDSYVNNDIDVSNVTQETYQAWHDGMIAQFASDDPELQTAIENKLQSMFDWLGGNKDKTTVAFDWSTFADENGLEDIEKLLGKIQTAYKNLEETGNGFALDSDILNAFPELAEHLDDVDTLKTKLQELSDAQMQPLIDQLKEIQSTLDPTSTDYSSIENIIKWLQQQADVTQKVKEKATKVSDLYKDQKLQIHENITALEREVKTIDKQISALEKIKKKQDEIVKALEKEKDLLEKQIKDYETAASTVKSVLDEQIKALEKQKDSLKDGYDKQIKGVEEAYKKQIELVKKQQENYDAQIKALRDEADEQDRLNDLKEKELALEKAKNEKVRVYDSSRGWMIQQNSESILAAQKDLDKARRDNEIARLEKEKESLEERITALETERDNRTKALEEQRDREIESYEKQIKALNDYKDAWEKAKDSYQKAQDEMTTAAVLGADWRQKALDKDMEIVNTYETEYSDLQTKLKETLEPQIEAAKKLADTYSEQADALKEQKDTYKELQDDQKKYLDFFKTYAEDMVKGTKDQKQAWDDFSEAIEKFTKISGFDNLKEFYDVAMQAYDEDYISTLLGDKAAADKKTGGTTNTNQLSSLEQLLNNINNSGAAKAGYAPMFTGFLQQSFLDNVEKSQKVYEAFQNSSSLLDNSARNLGVVTEQMSKSAGNWTTNNRSYQDNRTINVNGITVRMTEQEFTTYMNNYWKAMDRDSQVGKR